MTSVPSSPKERLPLSSPSIEHDIRVLIQQNFGRAQPSVQTSQLIPTSINPTKWHLDENTGEYLRVKHRRGDRLIVDTTPYSERWMESVLAEQELLKLAGLTLGFFIGGVVLWGTTASAPRGSNIIPGAGAIVCFLTSLTMIPTLFIEFVKEAFRDIGPEPVSQRPRREQAEQQRVHGSGRFMNRDEIHRAASGQTAFPTEEQQYED